MSAQSRGGTFPVLGTPGAFSSGNDMQGFNRPSPMGAPRAEEVFDFLVTVANAHQAGPLRRRGPEPIGYLRHHSTCIATLTFATARPRFHTPLCATWALCPRGAPACWHPASIGHPEGFALLCAGLPSSGE